MLGLRRGPLWSHGEHVVELVDLPAFGRATRLVWHERRGRCSIGGCVTPWASGTVASGPGVCRRRPLLVYGGPMVSDAESWDYPDARSGARWWRFDFHTHTPASGDYREGRVTPADLLIGFMRAGIDCVAVTDHNSGGWVDLLKSELVKLEEQENPDFQRLHLSPGVEISA